MANGVSNLMDLLVRRLTSMSRSRKRALMVTTDVVFIPAALWTALALKLGAPPTGPAADLWLYAISVVASIPIFVRLGLYRAVVRFIGPKVILAVVAGVSASVLVLAVVNSFVAPRSIPTTALVIYWALALVYVGGSRILVRNLLVSRHAGGDRVIIYGAGSAGAQAATALRLSGRFDPVAFVDDDRSLQGSVVGGVDVYSPSALPRLIGDEAAKVLLLAIPSQSRRRRQQILKSLEPLAVRVMTVPDISDLVSGVARVEDVRDVDASDLLGRDAVPPNERLIESCIRDKVVMVTGAGGSIGSELCRQILRLQPRRLVLFEMSELALYNIDRELRAVCEREHLEVGVISLLGNAHHKYRVREVLQAYGVQTVYHAAAYKHVPIVEHNVIEGVHNNVISTWYTAEAALECGVETFVLISTDKAVNPTNVMGATKRFAEMVLQGLNDRGSRTRFCMVRFGNVLESSGSVVPLFREQIRRGGPVTVTHPDVIRYFMTIPEASQLVLQAGAMARGGDVFVLDMGKPIRIADLARRMIHLSGLTARDEQNPEGDIEIRFTGLRPAEKLFEELLIGNNVSGTEHPMILRAMEHSLPWDKMQELLQKLLVAMGQFDVRMSRELLLQAVQEYQPSDELVDHVWRHRDSEKKVLSNVTSLQARRSATRRDSGHAAD
ncbi:MAG: polysaccharide biosynthesis protein [Steroidobacteraceae bacterium]|nr:polysaccharide biosynthesis protein [Steroidobacteraceae bacterium]